MDRGNAEKVRTIGKEFKKKGLAQFRGGNSTSRGKKGKGNYWQSRRTHLTNRREKNIRRGASEKPLKGKKLKRKMKRSAWEDAYISGKKRTTRSVVRYSSL